MLWLRRDGDRTVANLHTIVTITGMPTPIIRPMIASTTESSIRTKPVRGAIENNLISDNRSLYFYGNPTIYAAAPVGICGVDSS